MESLSQLKTRLEQRYQLSYETVDLGSRRAEVCYVANAEALFDQLIAEAPDHPDVVDERIPYWAELWPAAIGLAQWLLNQPKLARGTSVLELGAGLGLTGLAAHWQGGEVTLTDYIPESLEVARYLWQLNGEQPLATSPMDWRKPDPALAADLVIAADVAYEERFFEPLMNAFHQLRRPGGRIIVSEPNRKVGRGWLQKLVQEQQAVVLDEVEITFQGHRSKVSIYELTL